MSLTSRPARHRPVAVEDDRRTPARSTGGGPVDDAAPVRRHLSASAASAAGPYGYTITLGGSIALATERLGSPHLGGALLLMLGAVVAFVAVGLAAQGAVAPRAPLPSAPATVWGGAHVPSAGLALCAVWGIDQAVRGAPGWLLTGFAATAVYLVVCAGQQLAADSLRHTGAGGRRAP